jgi:hypothetical protein
VQGQPGLGLGLVGLRLITTRSQVLVNSSGWALAHALASCFGEGQGKTSSNVCGSRPFVHRELFSMTCTLYRSAHHLPLPIAPANVQSAQPYSAVYVALFLYYAFCFGMGATRVMVGHSHPCSSSRHTHNIALICDAPCAPLPSEPVCSSRLRYSEQSPSLRRKTSRDYRVPLSRRDRCRSSRLCRMAREWGGSQASPGPVDSFCAFPSPA